MTSSGDSHKFFYSFFFFGHLEACRRARIEFRMVDQVLGCSLVNLLVVSVILDFASACT